MNITSSYWDNGIQRLTFNFLGIEIVDFEGHERDIEQTFNLIMSELSELLKKTLPVELFKWPYINHETNTITDKDKFMQSVIARTQFVEKLLWYKIRQKNDNKLPLRLNSLLTDYLFALNFTQDKLYFCPFFQSKVFVYAFILYIFPKTNELIRYWNTYSNQKQFVKDLNYFIGLKFDPTYKYSLSLMYYDEVKRACDQIKANHSNKYVLYTQAKHVMSTDKEDSNSNSQVDKDDIFYKSLPPRKKTTRINKYKEHDDDDDYDSDDDLMSTSSVFINEIDSDEYNALNNEFDLVQCILDKTANLKELPLNPKEPYNVKELNAYMKVCLDLVPIIVPLFPAEAQRRVGVSFDKAIHLILLIPYMLGKNYQLLYDTIKIYDRISHHYNFIDPYTMHGLCIYISFFTETHIDMLMNDLIRHRLRATPCTKLFNSIDQLAK
jgi:hypothetical protein